MAERYEMRQTEYGYGIWDAEQQDWWIPRHDMTRIDAQRLTEELNAGQE